MGSAMLRTERVAVVSPASSANLGPGFDCVGLAVDITDEYTAQVSPESGVRVASIGEDADSVPDDHTHLVAAACLRGLAHVGVEPAGLDITCHNRIPHGRGLGSSSAAIVGGLALARELLVAGREGLSDDVLLRLADEIEGHPDNVAAAVLGGLTLAWHDDAVRAVRLSVHPDVRPVVFVPEVRSATSATRGLIPEVIPHIDAAFSAGRAALLVHALTTDPSQLLPATDDRLHQSYRRPAYPESLALVEWLRGEGIAAAISGAGPTVIAFDSSRSGVADLAVAGFRTQAVRVGSGVGAR